MKEISKLVRRKARIRYALRTKSGNRLRLSVYRSEKNIYAQIIDDTKGVTLVSASSKDKEVVAKGSTVAGATAVGKLIGERALRAGVKEVAFDRSGYLYHGRVKAVAEAAREAGLSF